MESNILNRINLRVVFISALVVILTACAAPSETVKSDIPDNAATANKSSAAVVDTASSNQVNTPTRQKRPKAEIYKGTGSLINKNPSKRRGSSNVAGDDVTLMFQDAPIEEVATTAKVSRINIIDLASSELGFQISELVWIVLNNTTTRHLSNNYIYSPSLNVENCHNVYSYCAYG